MNSVSRTFQVWVCIILLTSLAGCGKAQTTSNHSVPNHSVSGDSFGNVYGRASSYEESKELISIEDIPDYPFAEEIWKQPFPVDYSERYPWPIPMVQTQDKVYYVLNHKVVGDGYNINPENKDHKIYNAVVSFDPFTRSTQWVYRNEYVLSRSIAVSSEFVFVGTNVTDKAIGQDTNVLTALDIQTGKEVWTCPLLKTLPSAVNDTPEEVKGIFLTGNILYDNQQVLCLVNAYEYTQDEEGKIQTRYFYYLLSLNEQDGSVNWVHLFPPTVAADSAYLSKEKGVISLSLHARSMSHPLRYTVDPSKKQVKPVCDVPDAPDIHLFTLSDRTYFLSDDNKHTVGLYDPQTCQILWSIGLFTEESYVLPFQGLFQWEDQLLLWNDSTLCSIDLATKDVNSVVCFEGLGSYDIHTVFQNDSILYLGIGPQDWDKGDSCIIAYDMATQQCLWKWKFPELLPPKPGYHYGSTYFTMAPYLVENSLFFLTNHGNVYEMKVQ